MRSRAPLLLCLLMLSAACSSPDKAGPTNKRPRRASLVKVAEVRTGNISDRWRFVGDVRAASRATLAAGASGSLTRVTVREGDQVRRGALLAEVDAALPRARLDVAHSSRQGAEEALAQAEREQKRLDALEAGVVPAVELERARSAVIERRFRLDSAKAAEVEARAQLALHRTTAPFDGVVAMRKADPGEWVRPGDAVLELVSTQNVELIVAGSAQLFRHIRRDTKTVIIGPTRGSSLAADIAGIVPALDPVTRTVRIRLIPRGVANWLLPGAALSVEFAIDLSDKGVVVPQDALIAGPTETKIVRVDGDKAQHLTVDVLAKANADALIVSPGLTVGDRVVVRGNERLRPGQSVKVAQ